MNDNLFSKINNMTSLMTANAHILRGEQEKGDHRKREEGYIAGGLGTMAKL